MCYCVHFNSHLAFKITIISNFLDNTVISTDAAVNEIQ